LGDRFVAVHALADAIKRARSPEPGEFDWEDDRLAVWGGPVPDTPFLDPRVQKSFKKNFAALNASIDRLICDTLPPEYRSIYDDVYSDLVAIAQQFAYFARLDQLSALVWEAYTQGGWPCGCTGPGLGPDDELDLSGRKIYVYWEPEGDGPARKASSPKSVRPAGSRPKPGSGQPPPA
jgi:hypothetical protein